MSDKTISDNNSGSSSELPSDEWLAQVYGQAHADGAVEPPAALDAAVMKLAQEHHPGTKKSDAPTAGAATLANRRKGLPWMRIGSGFAAAAVVVLSVSVFIRSENPAEQFAEDRNDLVVASEFADLETAANQVRTEERVAAQARVAPPSSATSLMSCSTTCLSSTTGASPPGA